MAAMPRTIIPAFPRIAAGLLCGLLLLAASLVGAGRAAAGEDGVDARVVQAVSRLTYGPTPGLLKEVAAMGVPAFIDSQLDYEKIDESPDLAKALDRLPSASMDTVRLFREYGPGTASGEKPGPEAMRRTFDRAGVVALEAAEARLLRAILSRRQLYELMVAFWSEHFSLGAKKGLAHLWVGSFEREAIRPHAMGRFLDLLMATATHPAMLNARDTLGPAGPQKPEDTEALARILTGWRVGAARDSSDSSGFHFDQELHDPSDKTLLGHPIKGTGLSEGAAALRILATHPATAKNICHKLAAYFLADEPPAALVARMAETFARTDGDIREVLRTLFTGPEFFDPKYRGGRLKSPLRQVVSAARAVGAKPTDASALAGVLAGLGQPLYEADGPEGYPVTTGHWNKPDGLMRRVSFAGDLAAGRIPGLGFAPGALKTAALAETLGPTVADNARQAAAKAGSLGPAVLLAAPDFMRY